MIEKNTEKVKERKVSFYDPVVNAYREIPISRAREFIKVAENLKKEIEKK